ncbi:hypothetical protein LP43_0566 [Methylophaga thiooxydans]|uniref:DUF3301 domain-containing protein n=1 Tax=Methylophaga thiooxydans TaxID=392484 RepID=A0A0A0BHZ3_9GAMM|nr:DUF3301 domain-containing protein [Methylophaga thiooxydans]KGM08143.1 hypothetical protein LP43_0566 [Methylophaga thiooxydans]
MNESTFVLLVLSLLSWLWWDSRGVAERATIAARGYCGNAGVTFLNDTVAWQKMRLKRNRQGRMQLQRTYFFEFASDMQQRYRGQIIMLGKKVESVSLDVFRAAE